MLRSLYSGVSGMRNFQTKMDVIANNISNVNTTAFKSGRVRFQDMLNQTISNASSPSNTGGIGGTNPQQIGLGVKVGAIDTIMTGGAIQPTNRDLDFAIEREGFFAVSQDSEGLLKSYTRDGVFYTDYEGNLVNANGLRVLGYGYDGNRGVAPEDMEFELISDDPELDIPQEGEEPSESLERLQPLRIPKIYDEKELDSYTIDGSGRIIGIYGGEAYLLGQIGIVTFSNPEGLTKLGNNTYANSNNSGEPVAGIAGTGGSGTIRQGYIEMSNVDLANEFTEMIITSRAYQANSRSITTSDEMLQELINLKR